MLLHPIWRPSFRAMHLKTSVQISLLVALLAVLFRAPLHAQATAVLTGQVVSAETRLPVEGISISLQFAPGRKPLRTQTDCDGFFHFIAIPAGEVSLTLQGEGLVSKRLTVSLVPNQSLSLSVTMTRASGSNEVIEVVDVLLPMEAHQTSAKKIFTRRTLDEIPTTLTGTVQSLLENTVPSAIVSHDNILHLRGQEGPIQTIINGVSFLDNPHQHFIEGLSPRIFKSASFLNSGFSAEYGNRFGGILDIVTRSGLELDGHGSLSTGIGTQLNHNASFEYGDRAGKLGYYVFLNAFQSGRFLNPPTKREIHDLGKVAQSVFQIDYQGKKISSVSLSRPAARTSSFRTQAKKQPTDGMLPARSALRPRFSLGSTPSPQRRSYPLPFTNASSQTGYFRRAIMGLPSAKAPAAPSPWVSRTTWCGSGKAIISKLVSISNSFACAKPSCSIPGAEHMEKRSYMGSHKLLSRTPGDPHAKKGIRQSSRVSLSQDGTWEVKSVSTFKTVSAPLRT